VIVKPDHARLILRAKKTQVRRRVELSVKQRGVTSIGSPPSPRRPVDAGQELAVRTKPGGPEKARVTVLDVTKQYLGDLTQQDAIAEGYRTRGEYARAFLTDRKSKWLQADERSDDECLERLTHLYGHWRMWVITFVLFEDHSRFLSARPAKVRPGAPAKVAEDDESRGYTSGADTLDAGEAVPDLDLRRQTAEARDRDALRQKAYDDELLSEKRSLEERLARARKLAAERGVNVSSDVRVVEQRIERIERKIREQRKAA
jgi:hypothetical protein